MAVVVDILDGSLEQDSRGFTRTRVFLVNQVGGSPEARLWNARNAINVPRGTPDPVIPGIVANRFLVNPEREDNTIFRISVVYESPTADDSTLGATTVSMSTQAVTEETVTDVNGNVLRTQFIARAAIAAGFGEIEFSEQIHRVQVERPTFSLRISRTEGGIAFARAVEYAGKVNSAPWQGQPAKTWLVRISSSEIDGGLQRVEYDAIYNPRTWLAELRFTQNGEVPLQVEPGRNFRGFPVQTEANGVTFRDVYDQIDFNSLGLPKVI